ncbi:hypothetical protein L228DRAFT_171231 [Xylona heveae TC161]|uniref:Nucleotidyl transferase AbiEii/AbiGii toxin family protein n=1 Tax=Xylona heveae (strain CBS 132557 / TC161) TaxID=1328760 RepID=A0A165FTS0_XYLHT|nr:hypothetical protein L228DRAFT_171231 [Xylona heveae TC161]KZF21367.1 hypothetical protein L228DRAFT_171231 [Xylona heveae TC161]
MSSSPKVLSAVLEAAKAIGIAFASRKYAVVGGAACLLLGSQRCTDDVDLVVPQGQTAQFRNVLRVREGFTVEPRTAHTYYQAEMDIPIRIEILTPPILFKENFDSETPTVFIDGVQILKPALILNAKCRSILGRATDERKDADAHDIKFLLKYLAKNGTRPLAGEVTTATKDFFEWFTARYGNPQLWTQAGYGAEKGSFDERV